MGDEKEISRSVTAIGGVCLACLGKWRGGGEIYHMIVCACGHKSTDFVGVATGLDLDLDVNPRSGGAWTLCSCCTQYCTIVASSYFTLYCTHWSVVVVLCSAAGRGSGSGREEQGRAAEGTNALRTANWDWAGGARGRTERTRGGRRAR